MAAARNLLLRHLRLAAAPSAASVRPTASLQEALWGRRWMSSEDAKGSFLDKSEVTERIIKVVKSFPKIDDPSKVYTLLSHSPYRASWNKRCLMGSNRQPNRIDAIASLRGTNVVRNADVAELMDLLAVCSNDKHFYV